METAETTLDVLIVDDLPENLTVLRQILKDDGYHVRPALTGEIALKAVDAENPDLILLDVMMPGLDGFEVCKMLKKNPQTSRIPVVFISALDETETKVRGFNMGGVDYITKPFQKAEVLARVKTHITLSRLEKKTLLQNQMLVREIEERKTAERALEKANKELEEIACMDGLTRVANRRFFDITLDREWKRLSRTPGSLSLILCDLDYFKKFNDHYGHVEGDICLQKVARKISSMLRRPGDLAARYGGEEFAILMPDTDIGGAEIIAEEIRQAVQGLQIPHPCSETEKVVTLSLGASSMIPDLNRSMNELVLAADRLLYKAKMAGRNLVVV